MTEPTASQATPKQSSQEKASERLTPVIHQSHFITSAPNRKAAPEQTWSLAYAFLGRSNVGKSSFINWLTQRKSLAKTSNTPGKTRLINFFTVDLRYGDHDGSIALIDLPGYGYAKVSKTEQSRWAKALDDFITHYSPLQGFILCIDSRHGASRDDIQMLEWLCHNNQPFVVVLTKGDKSKRQDKQKAETQIRNLLRQAQLDRPAPIWQISTQSPQGWNECWHHLLTPWRGTLVSAPKS